MKKTAFLLFVLAAAAIGFPAWAGNGTILETFEGGSGPGYKPCPDTTGAVGPNQVDDFEDGWFMAHEKSTGRVLQQMTMSNFWRSVQPADTLVLVKPNDPRMLYDPLSQL